MKKHLLKLSFLIVTASMFCACDSFLDKQPSATSDAPITEVSQLLSLYDYVTNTYEYDYPGCLLYTSPSPRDRSVSRMPSSA